MTEKYNSKKDRSYGNFLLAISLIIMALLFGFPFITKQPFDYKTFVPAGSMVILILALFLWIWLDTNYTIKNDMLFVRSGPFFRRILIKDISLIRLNQKTIGGIFKLTLSWTCMEIKYKKYRAVMISPIREDHFLSALKKVNKSVQVL